MRAHEQEQRARADLEALVETTPVGVMVLDAGAGRPVSWTYEALIRQLWDGREPGDADRVRTFVKQLRRKLGDDPARPVYILNVRGAGYRVPKPEE